SDEARLPHCRLRSPWDTDRSSSRPCQERASHRKIPASISTQRRYFSTALSRFPIASLKISSREAMLAIGFSSLPAIRSRLKTASMRVFRSLTSSSSAAASEAALGNRWKYFNHKNGGNKPARRRLQRMVRCWRGCTKSFISGLLRVSSAPCARLPVRVDKPQPNINQPWHDDSVVQVAKHGNKIGNQIEWHAEIPNRQTQKNLGRPGSSRVAENPPIHCQLALEGACEIFASLPHCGIQPSPSNETPDQRPRREARV